ncbi:peptidylprolyl isomerase [Marinicella meishanensis]|uniref:peptidylprolyl isomerase n=1 Tax=Marinicella meishanensis TaxID=2873263 RepID=UPI001CBB05BD|nr:peptidylprolyl isomerase [Marinicella sp. NBU2979]
MKFICTILWSAALTLSTWQARAACADEVPYPHASYPELTIKTSLGEVVIELDRQRAPLTVNQFLHHVQDQRYDDNLVHRVVKEYVVQTGAFNSDLTAVTGCGQLFNESGNGLPNDRGTLAMARYDDPHSANSSFFINLKDNANLNPNRKTWGYTVFGYVVSGMDVVDQMAQQATAYHPELDAPDVPVNPIKIISVRLNP